MNIPTNKWLTAKLEPPVQELFDYILDCWNMYLLKGITNP